MTNREFGNAGEEYACKYLEKNGYYTVGRNVHIGHYEFDIICTDDTYIVFAEVKTRNSVPKHEGKFGTPSDAVDKRKRNCLRRGVRKYMESNELRGRLHPRIDIIEIYASDEPVFCVRKLNHYKGVVGGEEKSDYFREW